MLDAGSPVELIGRHALSATVRFTCTGDVRGLRELPGVQEVVHPDGAVNVRGERRAIAHVGAWLVPRGPIPPDLRVEVPDLEHALLALLDGASSSPLAGAA